MTVEEILQVAIRREIQSYELYTRAVEMVTADTVRGALRQLAQEELGHKALLEKMLSNPGQMRLHVRRMRAELVQDYGVGDHLKGSSLGPDATFQDVCIFASKKEQQSYEMYRDLAEQNTGEARQLFEAMSKDELRHKNLVESWYEEVVYTDF